MGIKVGKEYEYPWDDLPAHYVNALRVKLTDKKKKVVALPDIPGWNPALPLLDYQKNGVAYLYFAKSAFLADPVGLGKLTQSAALIQLLKSRGEPYKTIVVVPKNIQIQWVRELQRFTDLSVAYSSDNKAERIARYHAAWEVLVLRYSHLVNDLPYLQDVWRDLIILDEGSVIRNHDTATATKVKLFTANTERVIILDATPMQISLTDIHSETEALPITPNIFPPLPGFEMRYVRREDTKERTSGGKYVTKNRIIGYKNVDEFKERLYPFYLRRKASQVEGLPEIMPETVWLELPPGQRRHYLNAKQGIMEKISHSGEITSIEIKNSLHLLQQAADSTTFFGEYPPQSAKVDWLIRALAGDLEDEKVIVYCQYKLMVKHVLDALRAAHVSAMPYTGDQSASERDYAVKQFWDPAGVRVLVGTSALERGLNLQCARYLITMNRFWNPQREVQMAGRIRRLKSEFSTVFVINLMASDTIEEKMYNKLVERAAVAGYTFDEGEEDSMFPQLSRAELLDLLTG